MNYLVIVCDNETIIDASDEDEDFGVDYPNYDKDHNHEKDEWWNKDHGHWNNPWGHGWGHHENTSEMTDEQVQQVINYNEGGATPTRYPIYYDEIQDPPDNVTFTSMTEAESYECPWWGMTAIIDNTD